MDKEVLQTVIEKTNELLNVPFCCEEAKAAAQRFLDAVGTDAQKEEIAAYLKELEEDIVPIDGLIAFAESEEGKAAFGAEAPNVAAHGREIKANGAAYCDCAACAAAEAILANKDKLLK